MAVQAVILQLPLQISMLVFALGLADIALEIDNLGGKVIGSFRLHAYRSILELVIVDARFDYTKSDKFRRWN